MHEKNLKLAQLDFPRPHFDLLVLAGLDTYPSTSIDIKRKQLPLVCLLVPTTALWGLRRLSPKQTYKEISLVLLFVLKPNVLANQEK